MLSKPELRRLVRQRLSAGEAAGLQRDLSGRICEGLLTDPGWSEADTLAIFAPHRGEPDVELLWDAGAGRQWCYPRVIGDGLEFFMVESPSSLEPSLWGLREPPAIEGRRVPLARIDLLLVPGMAFTRCGLRLGRGGGFYDRLLARLELRAVTLGVCFEAQIFAELPCEEHDQRVARVVTEIKADAGSGSGCKQ